MDDKKQDKLKHSAEPSNKNEPAASRDEDDEILDESTKDSRDVLDQLEEPGGLEVEDMPESNELQERRRKTKNRLNQLASMREPGWEGTQTAPDGAGEEESGLFDLLREANLSTRHLKFCCGGVLGLFILVGLYFGGKALWNLWESRPDEPDVEEPVEVPDDEYWQRQIKCQYACPVHTDARGYVRAIANGDFETAYLIARGPNPLASICGRVCGAPCEASCRRGKIDQSV